MSRLLKLDGESDQSWLVRLVCDERYRWTGWYKANDSVQTHARHIFAWAVTKNRLALARKLYSKYFRQLSSYGSVESYIRSRQPCSYDTLEAYVQSRQISANIKWKTPTDDVEDTAFVITPKYSLVSSVTYDIEMVNFLLDVYVDIDRSLLAHAITVACENNVLETARLIYNKHKITAAELEESGLLKRFNYSSIPTIQWIYSTYQFDVTAWFKEDLNGVIFYTGEFGLLRTVYLSINFGTPQSVGRGQACFHVWSRKYSCRWASVAGTIILIGAASVPNNCYQDILHRYVKGPFGKN